MFGHGIRHEAGFLIKKEVVANRQNGFSDWNSSRKLPLQLQLKSLQNVFLSIAAFPKQSQGITLPFLK